jgi:hypothetical protein
LEVARRQLVSVSRQKPDEHPGGCIAGIPRAPNVESLTPLLRHEVVTRELLRDYDQGKSPEADHLHCIAHFSWFVIQMPARFGVQPRSLPIQFVVNIQRDRQFFSNAACSEPGNSTESNDREASSQ